MSSLLEDLMKIPAPFYEAKDSNYKHWPSDTSTKRYCSGCGWQLKRLFMEHKKGQLRRECIACFRKTQNEQKRLRRIV
jgi:hypothetical protein